MLKLFGHDRIQVAISYFTSKILCILNIELIALSDQRNQLTYKLINDCSGLTVLSVIDVKLQLLKSTIGPEHPLYGPSPPIMTLSEHLIYIPNAVSRSQPRIISYLPPVDSSIWHFHVTISIALNSDRHRSTFALFEVVNFPACVYHIVSAVYLVLSFYVSLPVTTDSAVQQNSGVLYFAFPLRVFIHPCRIGE